jgi:DNA-binding NarL/FixJ family response regulator
MSSSTLRPGRVARILIVDDHPLMREGLSARITSQPDMSVCGEAADLVDALAKAREIQPDLMIVDVALKSGHGLELIKDVKSLGNQIKILVLSAYSETLYAERALRAGALGYINKQEVQEKILEAIRTVLSGKRYVSQQVTERLVAQAVMDKDASVADPIQRLSNRELEVFQMIGRGMTTGAIARQLYLSVHTIDSHREKIRAKLNLSNSAELMQRAVQWVLQNG